MEATVELQKNIRQRSLALLLFSDEYCHLVRQSLPIEVWVGDPGIRALSESVYDFIDLYKNAPKSHSLDLVMGLSLGEESKKLLLGVVNTCRAMAASTDPQFVLDTINTFQQQHNLKQAIMGGMERLEKGDLDEAEQFVMDKLKHRSALFESSKSMADGIDYLKEMALNADEKYRFKIGIPELDQRGLCPTRRELWVIQASKKAGKSWMLIHAGKQALLAGKKVLHITLELRWEIVIQRYFQSFFSYKSMNDGVVSDIMVPSGSQFDTRRANHQGCLADISTVNELQGKLDELPLLRDNLRIKEFPSNTLTIAKLIALLDAMEVQEGFTPDEIIVDYGMIMHVPDPRQRRLFVGAIYLDLRRLAQERNVAVVSAIQTNRSGSKEVWADSTDIAEDFSVAMNVDCLITYNRTKVEAALGLARLWVSDARNSQGNFGVLISQNYGTGQFCLASQFLDSTWEKNLKDLLKRAGPVEEEKPKAKSKHFAADDEAT